MVRRITAGVLIALVQLGASGAPLVHLHAGDHETAHHDGPTVHSHFRGHAARVLPPSGSVSLQPGEHDPSTKVQMFVAGGVERGYQPAAPLAAFVLAVRDESLIGRALRVVHGHDPPPLRPPAARAPPTSIS